ncbi:polysaccharide pyruvyl transferase family protein [Alienimonas californiensis]|uniref:Polysaccharide pyruvyl transferase n=1 Tax=Alienimonas californiensis TaxID=2527989 RepID=A0A517P5K1_9PLAN|nr:polysaccharide pyruvyl transferase family protein [Alienimonas californiensis]QDT14636.1 Polysaccharide pyruvyl transferase [Alienimonas californiensis]
MLPRRTFLQSLVAALAAAQVARADESRAPRILLRSSWQVVNIGDIAHTPGVLALIEKHIPDAEVILWASGDLTDEVAAMEHKRFPKLKIVKGGIDSKGKASNTDLGEAVAWADFLLHGSGPSLVAARDVAAWVEHTEKPFGVYGITYGSYYDADRKALLSGAEFLYFRDTVSLEFAKKQGVNCPIMEFGPDGAFACDLRDDAGAEAFLKANGLEEGQFLCCLSRLRHTPYWTIPSKNRELDPEKHARNEEMKERDHAALRAAIVAVVRETPLKVLLCPEDMTQMAVGKEMFYDQLPADVKDRVVWRENFWLTDEALSVYVRSAGLFGSEMHSPIMAVGNGVPAIVCRFAEQTSKGYMWRDVGLGEWLFNLDEPEDHARIVPAVLDMAKNPAAAKRRVAEARKFVEKRQRETMAVLKSKLPA